MLPAPGSRYYAPQLDGLRFLAALAVYIHHAPPVPGAGFFRDFGWAGVDLFLCISAFLITRLLRIEFLRNGTLDLGSFYARRALRIWPLYLTYSTTACLVALASGLPTAEVISWWLSHISGTNNIMTAAADYSPIACTAHLWTISLEEQAYLVLPFVILAISMHKPSLTTLWKVAALLLAMMCLARISLSLADTPPTFIWTLPLRADAFILGALAAFATEKWETRRPGAWALCGLACLAAAYFLGEPSSNRYQSFGHTLTAAGFTCIVVAVQRQSAGTRLLGARPMRYLGTLSYGIYVYHTFCLELASKTLESVGLPQPHLIALLGLALAIACAAISYKVLEKPFLRLKERFTTVHSRPI